MAPISAFLLTTAIVASFLCIRKAALLLAPYPGRIWKKLHARELDPRTILQAKLYENELCAKLCKSVLRRKRRDALQAAMPEAIRLLCIALDSGSSLVMALRYAARNCSSPLSDELQRTIWDLDAGYGFDRALDNLRKRTGGTEFAFLAIAMDIQHQSGGSLSPILDNVAAMLKQNSDLKESLRTKTEQARLSSRIVAVIPFLLLAVLSLLTPGYFASFLSSPLGACMLVLALALETIGILAVRRCLVIDFSVDLERAA